MNSNLYWDESAAYELTALAIDILERVTAELQHLYEITCARAITENRYQQLGISEQVWPIVVRN